MCGIVGIVGKQSEGWIGDCVQKLSHRGPDDSGTFADAYLSLGQGRLSIQDLSEKGHQPMFDATGRFAIVYNGEVYNHWELRAELGEKYSFISTSDSETILYGFIEWGEAVFNKLNGIFACIIYDAITHDFTIVRDQFGVKPLYYCITQQNLFVASEMKAFWHLPGIDKTCDPVAISNYIHFLWCPGEQTPFKGIKKLQAGHLLTGNACKFSETVEFSALNIKKYYEIPFEGLRSDKSEAELIDELDHLLYQAVKRQLLSDVPLGFFLSGGLDSSGIVAMAKKIMPDQRLRCYTIDYGDGETDGFVRDIDYAQKVAEYLDVDLVVVKGDSKILDAYSNMIFSLDEPQTDIAPIYVAKISEAARKDGRVVLLGGTAGDDLFSGYRRHQVLKFEAIVDYIPKPLRQMLRLVLKTFSSKYSLIRRLRKVTANIHLNAEERMAAYYGWIDFSINKSLFVHDYQKALENHDPSHILIKALHKIPNEKDKLNQMLFWDLKYFLTDHNLNYTDKLGMSEGVEIRVPFLDKDLLEFSTRLPVDLKLKNGTTKYLLKKVMERYLPHDVIYRSKSGFGGPVREWIDRDLSTWVDEQLSKERISKLGIFDPSQVHKLIQDSRNGKVDAAYTVLALIGIHMYYDHFNHTKM